jgi:photosystem II stability/assembly factor-like uncharacterized protein
VSRPPASKLFGVNVATTVLATLVISIVGYGGATRALHTAAVASPAATPPPPAASPSPVESPPPRLFVRGFDLVDARTGWILLSNCVRPMTGECNYAVTGTSDGGQTWSPLVQVGPASDPADETPRTIRFVDAVDGFVYGGGGAFATHDGGKTWSTLDLHATFFMAISGRGQNVWAATYPCAKGTTCAYEVRSSHDAGRSWSVPGPLPIGFSPSEVIPFGTSGALISGPSSGDLEKTSDGGKTWRPIKGRCSDNPFRAFLASSDGQEIWELCMGYPAGASADKVLFVSEDGGASWSQKAGSQDSGRLPALGTQVSLISTRPGMLLVATEQTPLLLTRDAAASWTQVVTSPTGGTLWPRFANANDGWAMDAPQKAIWSTGDGGATWTLLPGYTPTP